MKFIIRPFSEIIVKSKPVRKRYLQFLQTNLNLSLKKLDESLKVKSFWDKLELNINFNDEVKSLKIINILSRTPWVESFIEVLEYDLKNFDDILDKCILLYRKDLEGKSFVVRVKRSGNHDFRSIDLERYLWGWILQNIENTKVDLHNPLFRIDIEIRDNRVYLVKNKFLWFGGFPVWTQDKVISLISWWFDSSVSSFSMIKRWCKLDYLFFNLGGKAHEMWVKQISNYIWQNFSSWYKAKFITVNFEKIVKHLVWDINHKYRWILLKRLFLMVADRISKENEYYAIIKWDSLWQVSSQTLKNMYVIDKSSETLVLRPLISFNKQEIINLAKQIGTYEFSCSMPEYCWVISDKPATWAKLEDILEEEKKFNFTLLEEAIDNKTIEFIDKIIEKEEWYDIEIVTLISSDEIVIDLREEPIVKEYPLPYSKEKIINISFFDIMESYKNLDQTKTYLFYCDKWVMSKNFAYSLREDWYKNIKIFRPNFENSCLLKTWK